MNNKAVIHTKSEVYIPLLLEELSAQMEKISSVRLPVLLYAHSKQRALRNARSLHDQGLYNATLYVELDIESMSHHEQKEQLTSLFSSPTLLTLHIVGIELLDALQQGHLCSLIEHYGTIQVRIIASASVSLFKRMNEGHFNRTLFYYLNVIPFELPRIDK